MARSIQTIYNVMAKKITIQQPKPTTPKQNKHVGTRPNDRNGKQNK